MNSPGSFLSLEKTILWEGFAVIQSPPQNWLLQLINQPWKIEYVWEWKEHLPLIKLLNQPLHLNQTGNPLVWRLWIHFFWRIQPSNKTTSPGCWKVKFWNFEAWPIFLDVQGWAHHETGSSHCNVKKYRKVSEFCTQAYCDENHVSWKLCHCCHTISEYMGFQHPKKKHQVSLTAPLNDLFVGSLAVSLEI